MPVYPLGSRNKWVVRLYHHGRPLSRNVNGSKRDAQDFEATWRKELQAQDPAEERTAPEFSTFCLERYQPHAELTLAKGTWRNRKYQVATLIEFFGETRLNKFTPQIVDQFRSRRRAENHNPTTINDDVKVLLVILNFAKDQKVPVTVPRIKKLKEVARRGLPKAWSKEEIALLFDSCQIESPRLLPVLVFLVNTGCRKTEAVELRWSCVHFKTGQVTIEPNEEWRPKDNEPRAVPLNSALLPWLERLRAENRRREHPSEFVFTGERIEDRWATWPQLLFDRARKSAVSPEVREKHLAKHEGELAECEECSKAALRGGPHKLRHTYASHYLGNGGDLFSLSQILGQEHARVTKLYSHMLPGALANAAERVTLSPSIGPAQLEANTKWKAEGR